MDRGVEYRHGFNEVDWSKAKDEAKRAMRERARRGRTLTYTDLCNEIQAIDFDPHDQRLAHFLGQISTEEHEEGRPLLTGVVVHKHDGQPGEGFFNLAKSLGFSIHDEEAFWVEQLNELKREFG